VIVGFAPLPAFSEETSLVLLVFFSDEPPSSFPLFQTGDTDGSANVFPRLFVVLIVSARRGLSPSLSPTSRCEPAGFPRCHRGVQRANTRRVLLSFFSAPCFTTADVSTFFSFLSRRGAGLSFRGVHAQELSAIFYSMTQEPHLFFLFLPFPYLIVVV